MAKHALTVWMISMMASLAPVAVSAKAVADKDVDFATQILPILSDKCFACHGPDAKKREVRLDSFEGATVDLGGYKAIDVDNLAASEIIARIFDKDDPMPPEDAEQKLSEGDRDLLKKWVLSGGGYAQHWAFVPPVRHAPPVLKKRGIRGVFGARREETNAIDAFVYAKLAAADADFAPEADLRTLARRVSLTLTGLPPTPADVAALLADTQPGAYERYVDTVLSRTAYGEHQARYWLDAVRYGDTHGLHLDNKRSMFPYRDWVIRAFNQNLPFDEFVTWQLAGDLLPNPSLEQQVASGYVRLNPSTAEGGVIPAEFQAKNNFDRTENFGTVFLGMTMLCARCHTHKYDPITHEEYFRLFAFFNSTAESPLDGNKYHYAPTVKAPANQADWDLWEKLTKQQASAEADDKAKLAEELAALEKRFQHTLVAKELAKPRKTQVLNCGEYSEPIGDALEPDVLTLAGLPMPQDAPRNRLGLAQWLLHRDNPLTTRVLVNRIWQRVYGDGLVRTPEDFGLQGQQPTHPALLDWLAVEFQDNGWDLKAMLKMMVTSKTFRQQSAVRPELNDPENKLFGRGPRRRLAAEELRDLALWSSGLLRNEMGGEGVKPYQPAGMWLALAHPRSNTRVYKPDNDDKVYRRSLYVYWKRTSPHPAMTLFDAPSREVACVRRSRSNTPLQSLALFNEPQRVEAALALADRVLAEGEGDDARLSRLFQLLASREPTATEADASRQLLAQLRQRLANAPERVAEILGQPKKDAPTPPASPIERAVWSQLAVTALAADFTINLY